MREHGRHSQALHDALDAIKVSKVSQATEFEDFRQLPKFSHVALGVIHPSPVKRMAKPIRPDPELEAEFSPYRLQDRPEPRPEFPESLMRAPRDESAGEKRVKPRATIAFGSKQNRFQQKTAGQGGAQGSMRQSLAEREAEQQLKMEAEKAKEINSNFKKFLEAISKGLKKGDDEQFCDQLQQDYKVREAKKDAEGHRLFHKLVDKILGKPKSNIKGQEFIQLI